MGSCPDTDIDPHFLFTQYSFFFFCNVHWNPYQKVCNLFQAFTKKNAVKSQGAQVLYEVRFHSVTPQILKQINSNHHVMLFVIFLFSGSFVQSISLIFS